MMRVLHTSADGEHAGVRHSYMIEAELHFGAGASLQRIPETDRAAKA
jgi:hypothetical protein